MLSLWMCYSKPRWGACLLLLCSIKSCLIWLFLAQDQRDTLRWELPASVIFVGVTFGISQFLGAFLLRVSALLLLFDWFFCIKTSKLFPGRCGETYVWHPASKPKRSVKKKKRKKKQTHKKKNEKPSNVLSFNHLCFSTTIPLGNPMHRFSANKRRFYWRTNSLLISEAWLTFQWIPALCTHSSRSEMAGQSWPSAQHVAQCPARASCESLFRCCFPLEDAPVLVRASPLVTQNSREPRCSHQAFPRGETSSRCEDQTQRILLDLSFLQSLEVASLLRAYAQGPIYYSTYRLSRPSKLWAERENKLLLPAHHVKLLYLKWLHKWRNEKQV